MTVLRAGGATDIGRVRTNNQDQMLVTAELYAVADGMGGHAAGEVASLTAVEALKAAYQVKGGTEGLVAATHQANRSIFERAQENPDFHGMGTTLVAVALVNEEGEDRLAVVNVGDSRVYLMRQGELEQLTTDHSLVQELVDDGQLTELEATVHPQRHVLTRALGVDSEVNVDVLQVLPLKGDRLLLCSDGLSRELSDDQVASILRRLGDPDDAARELVNAAKNRGGNDNITVVIVDVVDDGDVTVAASAALASDPGVRIPSPMPAFAGDDLDDTTKARTTARSGLFRPEPAPVVAKTRPVTLRVVGFLALLIALIGGAGVAVAWYARSSYFVGLNNDVLTIYKGRPGGLLWFKPTVAKTTDVQSTDVLPSRLSDLRSGKEEPSLSQAEAYVTRLQAEQQLTTTTTTVPAPTTTTPTSLAPTGGTTTVPHP
jgi:PPM family protein phosphatase